jgi:hypothetical protein
LKLQLFFSLLIFLITFEWGEKKTEKSIKPRKLEKKNNRKNRTVKKNRLKFKKKTNRFDFDFINLKPKKLNRTKPKLEKKPSQTEKTEQIDLNRFFF